MEIERKYTEVKLVLLSPVYACRTFKPYLVSRSFVVLTSDILLLQLVNNFALSRSMIKWLVEL